MSTIYAVRKGRTPGIYDTWSEAEVQIKGFSGAEHKKFDRLEDAEAFMKGETPREEAGAADASNSPRRSDTAGQEPCSTLRDDLLAIPVTTDSILLARIAEVMGYERPESVRRYLRSAQDSRNCTSAK